MYFFGDNYEASKEKPEHEIFCYGGYLLKKNELKDIEKYYYKIKKEYNIPRDLPIKWNLKDVNLKKIYMERGQEKLLGEIIKNSNDIREKILSFLSDFSVELIFCSFRELREKTKKIDFIEWSFTNILQRIFYKNKRINIVLDRDEYINNLSKTYFSPYYLKKGINGEDFYENCIKNICNSLPFISFSVTVYNPFLQIADIIIGACGNFLKNTIKNIENKQVKKCFLSIIPKIRGYPNKIFEYGFLIHPSEDKGIIQMKFNELLNLKINNDI